MSANSAKISLEAAISRMLFLEKHLSELIKSTHSSADQKVSYKVLVDLWNDYAAMVHPNLPKPPKMVEEEHA